MHTRAVAPWQQGGAWRSGCLLRNPAGRRCGQCRVLQHRTDKECEGALGTQQRVQGPAERSLLRVRGHPQGSGRGTQGRKGNAEQHGHHTARRGGSR